MTRSYLRKKGTHNFLPSGENLRDDIYKRNSSAKGGKIRGSLATIWSARLVHLGWSEYVHCAPLFFPLAFNLILLKLFLPDFFNRTVQINDAHTLRKQYTVTTFHRSRLQPDISNSLMIPLKLKLGASKTAMWVYFFTRVLQRVKITIRYWIKV